MRRFCIALLLLLPLTAPLAAQDPQPGQPWQPAQPEQPATNAIEWNPWSARYLQNLRDKKERVFVFVFAQWDLSSLANEENALKHPDVVKLFNDRKIVALRADNTQPDPAIKDFLALFSKQTVPLAVYYAPGAAKGVVLPDDLTGPKSVISLIEKADKDAGAAPPVQPLPTPPVDPQPTPPVDPQPTPPIDPQPTPPVDPHVDTTPPDTHPTAASTTDDTESVPETGLPHTVSSFFGGLIPGRDGQGMPAWVLGTEGQGDGAADSGKWFFIITAILVIAIGVDWRRPLNLRTLDVLLLIGIYPFVLWKIASPEFAYSGIFGVTAYFFARLLLDGHRTERPPAGYAPVPALILVLLVTLAWNGFVIAKKPVGGELQRVCMGAELLDHTNKLPYGQTGVMGDNPMSGPLTYFVAWPLEAAMPATAHKGDDRLRIVPADAAARAQMNQFGDGTISGEEADAGGFVSHYPAARVLTGIAHAIIVISLIALGWQFRSVACGLTLAILWGLNPFVLQGMNHDLLPLVLAPVMLAIALRHNSWASGVSLAAAAGIGVWPVLLFPLFLGYYLPNDFRKTLIWISIFAFTIGFWAMLQPGTTNSGVGYDFIGYMMVIVGLATGASTMLYTGSVTHKWAGFTMFYAGSIMLCMFLLVAFTSPVGLLTPEAKEQGVDVQSRLNDFVGSTVGRHLQTDPAVPTSDWWSLRGRGYSAARIELVVALVLICFVLSFLPDRPTSQSLVTLSAVVVVGATLWMTHAGHGWSPWWMTLAVPALLLPMPRRDRDDVPGWENDPVRSVDDDYDEIGDAERVPSESDEYYDPNAPDGPRQAHDLSPVNVPPDAQPPSMPPPPPGLVSGGAKPGLAGLTVQSPSSPSPRRDRPAGQVAATKPKQADISSTQDIAHYLQNEFGAEVDEMSADALSNTGMPPRVPPPPPPPPPHRAEDESYIGGTIGLEMPAGTMEERRPGSSHQLIDDEPRIITTPPQDETQWDPETRRAQDAHDQARATKAGLTNEATVENPRHIPEPSRPDDSTDFFTKSNLLTPDPDDDVEEIE